MTTIDPAVLARAMSAMAGDRAAVVGFVELFGANLAACVRRHLVSLGRRDLAVDDGEVGGLVWDVALLLQAKAGSWRPGSARPWNWAGPAIRSMIANAIGHARADVEPDQLPLEATPPTPARDVDVDACAAVDERLALLLDALAETRISPLHRQVHLEYRVQVGMGDPSPACTVAETFGLTPANVRQIDRRARVRLAELVRGDDRFTRLRELSWLGAAAAQAA